MPLTKPFRKKFASKIQKRILGHAEVEWEIVGWSGSPAHEILSRASCVVSIFLNDHPLSNLKLLFHLKPNHGPGDLIPKCPARENQHAISSSSCICTTCVSGFLSSETEFQPKTGIQSVNYSLLVDALTPQDNVMLSIAIRKLNSLKCTTSKVISVEPGSTRRNLIVEANFSRMFLWTVDQNGNVGNCTNTIGDNVNVARFHLSVTVYKLMSLITEDSIASKQGIVAENNGLRHLGKQARCLEAAHKGDVVANQKHNLRYLFAIAHRISFGKSSILMERYDQERLQRRLGTRKTEFQEKSQLSNEVNKFLMSETAQLTNRRYKNWRFSSSSGSYLLRQILRNLKIVHWTRRVTKV